MIFAEVIVQYKSSESIYEKVPMEIMAGASDACLRKMGPYVCVNNITEVKSTIELTVVVPNDHIYTCEIEDEIYKYLNAIGIEGSIIHCDEIGHDLCGNNIYIAGQTGYIHDSNNVFDTYKLYFKILDKRWDDSFVYCYGNDASSIIGRCMDVPGSKVLREEVDRIFERPNKNKIAYHPVHYAIESDLEYASDIAIPILLESLLCADRLASNRYGCFNLTSFVDESVNKIDLRLLFEFHKGGTLVFDATCDDSEYYLEENGRRLGELIYEYKDTVLTIFLLPTKANKIKSIMAKELLGVEYLSLIASEISGAEAKEYLLNLAIDENITIDEDVINRFSPERTYKVDFVERIFKDYKTEYANKEAFSQYEGVKGNLTVEVDSAKGEKGVSAEEKLEKLVGLAEVKEQLKAIVNRAKVEKILEHRGIGVEQGPKNFIFTGNPGVSKTTVAKLLAEYLKEEGVLSKGGIVEAGRKNVIGRYTGETTNKMRDKLLAAKGSILFIDEAYSLAENWGENRSSYGQEAIDVIVDELGNPESDRVVILAGYPKEMERFLDKNPGLRSRFNYRINFPDYTEQELFEILTNHAKDKKMHFEDDVESYIMPILQQAKQIKEYGNGRFVVNVLDKAITRQRIRIMSEGLDALSDKEVQTLKAEDFADIKTMVDDLQHESEKIDKIGFNTTSRHVPMKRSVSF